MRTLTRIDSGKGHLVPCPVECLLECYYGGQSDGNILPSLYGDEQETGSTSQTGTNFSLHFNRIVYRVKVGYFMRLSTNMNCTESIEHPKRPFLILVQKSDNWPRVAQFQWAHMGF